MRLGRAVAAAALAGTLAAPATALTAPQQLGSADLLRDAQAELRGVTAAHTGWTIAALGDVNGDGRDDVAIGMPGADANGRPGAGAVAVVFGRRRLSPFIDLGGLRGRRGFVIAGAAPGDAAGSALAVVRARGRRPLLAIGAPHASPAGRAGAGAAYLVDPARGGGGVDLAHDSRAVAAIAQGSAPGGEAGYALAAGDLNGDRRDELVIGAPAAKSPHGDAAGEAFVVFGARRHRVVDLSGAAVARVQGAAPDDGLGSAVAVAPAKRGALLLLGAPTASPGGRSLAGSVFVLRGVKPGAIDLASAAPLARLEGGAPGDGAGGALAPVGALERGRGPELAVGAPGADPSGRTDAGLVVVLPLRSLRGAVNLGSVTAGVLAGAQAGDGAGFSLAAARDLSTGAPALAVGAPFADRVDQEDDGAAYLVRGGAQRVGGDLGSLGSRGLTIRGARGGDEAGTGLAMADLDGDRRPDLLIGAPFALARPGVVGGAVYLLRGAR